MATFATTKQSVLDRINTLASSSSTTAEESIYLAKALRDAAQDITFVWRGPWQATYAYVVGDVAQYDGNAYYCINAHTAGTSFSSGSGSWQTMVVGGTKFWSGSSAPTGAEDGDLFLDTDDEKLYHQVSGSWSLVVDLGGNIWTSGTTVPANSSGEDGDFFLKTDDEKLYQRESGAWTFKVDLGGSRWTSSAAAPSNSNGEQGDVHFDTATQKIYEKGASAWSELADLTPLQADWNGTGLAAILNKPTFKTIGGSNIVGSGDIAVVPADGSITDAKIAGMSSSKLSGALPAIDGSSLTNLPAGGIVASGQTGGDGGVVSGDRNTVLGSISSIDLSACEGKRLFVTAGTALNESSNYADNQHVSIWLNNGSTEIRLCSKRSYSLGTNVTYNQPHDYLEATGIYTIPASYAVSGSTIKFKGGTNGTGSFIYGDSLGSVADGEQAGWSLTYFVA